MTADLDDEPEEERTLVVPRPAGGRRMAPASPAAAPPRAARSSQPPAWAGSDSAAASRGRESLATTLIGLDPLIVAASTLIALAVRIRSLPSFSDVEGLRERVIGELRRFEEEARDIGLAANMTRAAHYALCATVDDIVLNMPWGNTSLWTRASMVNSFHNEATGGERFYTILESAMADPARHLQLIKLQYLCIAMGFVGRYRLVPNGPAELGRIRDAAWRAIRSQSGSPERDLSVHWHGIQAPRARLNPLIPNGVSIAAAAVLAMLVLLGLSLKLNAYSDQAFAYLAALPPTMAPARALPPPSAAPPPSATPPAPSRAQTLLEPEVRQGLVTVTESPVATTIRVAAAAMFDSGSAKLNSAMFGLIQRIGEALHDQPGSVTVAGYTDNVPIRTLQFPSNWKLSQARADAVKAVLQTALSDPGRTVEAVGYGDASPIGDNATADGRQRNRRIEVLLRKAAPGGQASAR